MSTLQYEWMVFALQVALCSLAALVVGSLLIKFYFVRKKAFMDQLTSDWPAEEA